MGKFRKKAKGRYINKNACNEEINFPLIKIVLPDEWWAKEVSSKEWLKIAQSYWLDLVLISETSKPPLCKIIDYWKFLYDLKKKDNKKNKSQAKTEIKWIRLSLNIWEHDFNLKAKQAIWFLEDKNSVKVEIRFKWREMSYQEMWVERMKEFAEMVKDYWKIDQAPKLNWRKILMSIVPVRKK